MHSKQPVVREQFLPGGQTTRGHVRRPWVWRVAIIVAILVIVAIVVPIAVVLSRKHTSPSTAPKANVIVPLYVYPGTSGSAWQPLYNAANSSSSLNFTVIVNPNDGPGPDAVPDANYIAGIEKLNSFPNVRTLGYVHTTYATRGVNDVISDVNVYSNWAQNSSRLAVDGIFFDEAPWQYSSDHASYVQQLHNAAKIASGISGDKLIVFNPGVVPTGPAIYSSQDVVVAFENTYDEFETFAQTDLSRLASNRTQYAFMVHTVPTSADLASLVNTMSQNADYLFVTSNPANDGFSPYSNFSSIWSSFVHDVPTMS